MRARWLENGAGADGREVADASVFLALGLAPVI